MFKARSTEERQQIAEQVCARAAAARAQRKAKAIVWEDGSATPDAAPGTGWVLHVKGQRNRYYATCTQALAAASQLLEART